MSKPLFTELSEEQWDSIEESLIGMLYPHGMNGHDDLNLNGWLSDLEAGDADMEEFSSALSHAYIMKHYDPDDILQEANMKDSIAQLLIEVSLIT